MGEVLMSKHIFIVNGKPRAGKDTFADILGKITKVKKYSSIDKVKWIAKLCGWSGGKTEVDRRFLSDLKVLTSQYSDMAFKDIEREVKDFIKDTRHEILLIDIREPEEIERACKFFGAKSIFIENENVEAVNSNMADANVRNYKYDYYIINNGTIDEFGDNIINFYTKNIRGGREYAGY